MSSAGRGWTERQRGFTLVELVVVMVIIGLMTLMTLPVFSRTMKGLKLRRAVQEMASVMRYARAQAIFRQAPKWVALDMEQNRYLLGDGMILERDLTGEGVAGTYPLPDGVELRGFRRIHGSDEPRTGWIQFYANGSSSGGSVILASAGREARILLEPFTGLPNVEMGGGHVGR